MNTLARQIAMPILGEQASGFYQTELNQLYGLRHNRQETCPVQLLAMDFARLNANLPDNYAALIPQLAGLLDKLKTTGCAVYLLPNITLHAAVDRLDLSSAERAKIVHPVVCGVSTLEARGIKRITLAGTRHTMASDQLANYFEEKQIAVDFPDAADIQALDSLRLEVFSRGYSEHSKTAMEKLLAGYDNTVLACTELSMLNTNASFIDLARLQMAAAVARL